MWNWKNNMDGKYGIPYSRYVASWYNAGGRRNYLHIKAWLKDLGLEEDDCANVADMATNGKLELEEHARNFLKSNKFRDFKKTSRDE